MEILKIPALCLITALICIIFKGNREEYSFVLSVSVSVLILGILASYISSVISELNAISENGETDKYIKLAVKVLGISYVTVFSANTCRDYGQTALASKAELAGRCAIAVLGLPLIKNVLDLALGFLEL